MIPIAQAMNDAKFRLVFSHRMAIRLNRFNLPFSCSIRARNLYRSLDTGLASLAFLRRGMTGTMPRSRAACRFASESYPLSAMTPSGVASGPISSRVSNCLVSLASLPVRWKSSGRPSASHLMWIFVPNPPRERPSA